ncbi:MAG: tRNA preQ1(34) S-adenosylmethionine ribosyltransferase-isomerase QueA [Myxococcota bacterium]
MPMEDRLAAWDFDLPDALIARVPASPRRSSRLLVLPRDEAPLRHHAFVDLPDLLREGDLLVANDTKVMAARLFGQRASGGRIELLVLAPGPGPVEALAKPAKKLSPGDIITIGSHEVPILAKRANGIVEIQPSVDLPTLFDAHGELPLPPYLGRRAEPLDQERYQTIFAGPLGAAAAPTAGLHFDETVLADLNTRGIELVTVTLHVGLGTFRPLRDDDLDRGHLHEEAYVVPESTREAMARTRARGGRIIAIGTTSARTLESATPAGSFLPRPGAGTTDLFVRPPYTFKAIDGLITNFHLPRSSLLMIVAALTSRVRLLDAYAEAIRAGYRFYSYGDAMLLL